MIRGHQLSRNEYLKVRVYNEEEARKNWGAAVIQPAAPKTDGSDGEDEKPTTAPQLEAVTETAPEDLTVG